MHTSHDATRHQATLDLLEEALAYLERLPRVPTTLEVCRKIADHLDDSHAQTLAAAEAVQSGGYYTPAGRCLVQATLYGQSLTVQILAPDADELRRTEGLTFDLAPVGNAPSRVEYVDF